ncbi:MarR family transcriptional regulator [uncultured Tyzzerella sp.]|uniref:MarR family winged helix-turn-helix transcriptional regulator n=1 Tax=uncultured Tyzzerella sp. TaxID=2321398 RepID=UPI0029427CD7|nr:MarR family transcriptional regulator [uncultured Tyzzerella sp.]
MCEEESIILKIRKVSNLLKRYAEDIINRHHQYNLTSRHIVIAKYLLENQDKDIFQKDIEEKFCIRRSTVTSILNVMEKNGIIKRERVGCDARLKKVVLTEKSKAIHNNIVSEIIKMEQTVLKGIDDEELKNFYKVLEKIENNIK